MSQNTGLFWNGEELALTQIDLPPLRKNEARIRVKIAGVCNTDLEIIKGYMGFQGILGHEFVGIVEDAPDAPHWQGRRVCVDINAACDEATNMKTCDTCGNPHHCPNRSVIGIVNHHGAFAHYVTAPLRNLYAVPDAVTDEEAVFVEPLAAAFEIVEQVQIQASDKVVILGDGKLGLLIAMALRLHSQNVTLVGRHPEKLACVEGLGIHTVLSGETISLIGADVVVEATGTAGGIEEAIALLKPRGVLVLKSTVADTKGLNLAPVVVNELTIVGSRCGPFDVALEALASGEVPVGRLIQHRFTLSEGIHALDVAAQKGMLKVLLSIV
ncbi:MAG: alcohol dehydrogenase catalytic domain-containing protein [Vampirovibrionales bacterium]|jgi:threonine dehydrogenase-like Zn-dependent dehydrogenase|nr:alcohol dehydrogenase catalytic domain-containing protein [Vampirovibrionales bacterium]